MADVTLSLGTRESLDGLLAGVEGEMRLGLVILWSRDEPDRIGELVLMPSSQAGARAVIGREGGAEAEEPRLRWQRPYPGGAEVTGELRSAHISRRQLALEVRGPHLLEIENLGRSAMVFEGKKLRSVQLHPGQLITIHARMLLMCVRRPPVLPVDDPPLERHRFGEADAWGIVGESPAAWQLRSEVAFVGPRGAHVLIRGASGTGKELVAQAIHAASERARSTLVSRNAATFPDTLVDAELFGNAKGYPQAGMPERPGLVGAADGSSLFLDEFAELPQSMQAHLLRVLDAGEYTRLGDARPRHSDFRLLAATNRPESAIKADVLARMRLRVELPGLESRREDIPLIARHLLRKLARDDEDIARRYFPNADPSGHPRITRALIQHLVQHDFSTHVRELEALLWRAMTQRRGEHIDLWSDRPVTEPPPPPEHDADRSPEDGDILETMPPPDAVMQDAVDAVDPNSLSPEEIQACLDKHDGAQEPVWRELGLSSRHVLTRLVRRYGLKVRGRSR